MSLQVEELQNLYSEYNKKYFEDKLPKSISIQYKPLFIDKENKKCNFGNALMSNFRDIKGSTYTISFNSLIVYTEEEGQKTVLLHEMNHLYEFIYERKAMKIKMTGEGLTSAHGPSFTDNSCVLKMKADGIEIKAFNPCPYKFKD